MRQSSPVFDIVMSDKMSIDKKEHSKDESEESIGSSPENEAGPSIPPENQPAKRKGGRKPVSIPSYCLNRNSLYLVLVVFCYTRGLVGS